MREVSYDYGPVPFRFFHYWFEIEGFDKLVEDSWKEAPETHSNAYLKMMKKLRYLKDRIRVWSRLNKESLNRRKRSLKSKLVDLDLIIDKGAGEDTDVNRRHEVVRFLQEVEKIESLEVAQKVKIKWAIEGDENSKFYHSVLNKKRGHLAIRGFLPQENHLRMEMDFPNRINSDKKEDLEREISKEEIKRAVWDCGTHKAPGQIPKGGNSSFIALIPKLANANMVKDFRPISLIGSLYKIIAKILVNRLVIVLGDLVNEIQSAFVANRQILDGPFILNELLQLCKNKKKQSMVFKGDPLSPFLFILVMESLHVSFQRVVDADDAIFMGQWSEYNIDTIVHVLDCFHRASGLRINMAKSKLMGISVDGVKVERVAAKIGCVTLKTPFTYLGACVGGLMSRLQSWNEIVESMATRLSKRKLKTLSIGGRLTLLKSVVIKVLHGEDGKIGKKVKSTYSSLWLNIIHEVELLKQQGGNLKGLIAEEAWETIEDCAKCDKQLKNPTSTISDQTITTLNDYLVGNEVTGVKISKCVSWLDAYDEPIGDLDIMKDKVENPSPQVLPSFEVYTQPMTYLEEVEETLGTPIEVEPLDETQLEDLGLNTCNHDLPLSSIRWLASWISRDKLLKATDIRYNKEATTEFTYALRFEFDATNKEAKYEALITGPRIAEQMGIQDLQTHVDFRLVANQVNGSYIAKESGMIQHLGNVKTLANSFKKFSVKQVPISKNKKTDALSKIASTSFAYLTKQILVEILKEKSRNEAEVIPVVE
ncbi:RNA-directed DNA polymerase, eukaryota, reverse transcriptase zinc-binding domain protein [Tanacetum coccineum]